MRETFIRRQVARLRTDFGFIFENYPRSDEELTRLVGRIIDKAASYNVANEQDVETYLDCVMTLNRQFDQDPRFAWAGRILQRKDLTGTEKMSLIHDHLLFTVR